MTATDWPSVAAIYQQGIETGNATFEQSVPSWDIWDSAHLESCRIIAENQNEIAGWAALTPVSGRCVYAGVAEVSVYISNQYKGQKLGTNLLLQLIEASEAVGLWTLQSSIFEENEASIRLHEKCGFRRMGYREKIGKMKGVWRNTVMLERRSSSVGID